VGGCGKGHGQRGGARQWSNLNGGRGEGGDSTGDKQGMCSAVSTEYLWLRATRPGMLVGKRSEGGGACKVSLGGGQGWPNAGLVSSSRRSKGTGLCRPWSATSGEVARQLCHQVLTNAYRFGMHPSPHCTQRDPPLELLFWRTRGNPRSWRCGRGKAKESGGVHAEEGTPVRRRGSRVSP
jgi:hypothetical protein